MPEYNISPLVKDQLVDPFSALNEMPSFKLALMAKLDMSIVENELSNDINIDIHHSEISPDGKRIALLIDTKAVKELWMLGFTDNVVVMSKIQLGDNFSEFRLIHWDPKSPEYLYGEVLFNKNDTISHQIWRFRYDGTDLSRISANNENYYLGAVYPDGNSIIIGISNKLEKGKIDYFIHSLIDNTREKIENPRYYIDFQLWDFTKSHDNERISPDSSFSAFSIPVIDVLGSDPPTDNSHIAVIEHATKKVFAMIFDQQLFYSTKEHIIFQHQNYSWFPDSSGFFVCFTSKDDPFNEKTAEIWNVLIDGTEKRLMKEVLMIATSTNGKNMLMKYNNNYFIISTDYHT